MNPIFISSIVRALLSLKRVCPACKRTQLVPAEKKMKPVRCKFCGTDIPADKRTNSS